MVAYVRIPEEGVRSPFDRLRVPSYVEGMQGPKERGAGDVSVVPTLIFPSLEGRGSRGG